MPKLEAAGYKNYNDAQKAIKSQDPKVAAAVQPCANLIRGY